MIHRILLVEDDPKVASFVRQGLDEEGYIVDWVMLGEEALRRVANSKFDLLLLDIRLPDISGLEVCRRLRLHEPALPVLMLTALDAVEDRVQGLRAGADDYLPKPFAFDELLARIEALLRRARTGSRRAVLKDGLLAVDPLARTCTYEGAVIDLTSKEFDLLAYFVARPNQALRRDDIHRQVWGYDFDRGTNLIDVYVGYVRRKLEEAGADGRIEAVRGVGYRYLPATESHAAAGEN